MFLNSRKGVRRGITSRKGAGGVSPAGKRSGGVSAVGAELGHKGILHVIDAIVGGGAENERHVEPRRQHDAARGEEPVGGTHNAADFGRCHDLRRDRPCDAD